MPPSPIRPHIPQPPNVVHHLPSQIILNRQLPQRRGQIVDLRALEVPDFGGAVDVEARHQACAELGADAVEGLQGAGDEARFEEVGAGYEDLGGRWVVSGES